MIIRRIAVEGFSDHTGLSAAMDPGVTVISGNGAGVILRACEVLLSCTGPGSGKCSLPENALVKADIETDDGLKHITVSHRQHRFSSEPIRIPWKSPEEVLLGRFSPEAINCSKRLMMYMDPGRYCRGSGFSELTHGIGCTETFRKCLRQFIRDFEPESIDRGKGIFMDIGDDGRFFTYSSDRSSKEVDLSHEGETLFEYICFLKLNEFWDRLRRLIDMHYNPMPLTAEVFPDIRPRPDTWERIIRASAKSGHQVILLSREQITNAVTVSGIQPDKAKA